MATNKEPEEPRSNAELALESDEDLTFVYEIISHVGEKPIKDSTSWHWRDGVNNGWQVPYLQDYEDRPEKEVHELLDENVTDYLYKGHMAGEFNYPEENPYYTIKWRLYFRETPEEKEQWNPDLDREEEETEDDNE